MTLMTSSADNGVNAKTGAPIRAIVALYNVGGDTLLIAALASAILPAKNWFSTLIVEFTGSVQGSEAC